MSVNFRLSLDYINALNFFNKKMSSIKNIKELELMCEPDVSVIAFTSKYFNVLKVLDEMIAKGWLLNAIQNPTG